MTNEGGVNYIEEGSRSTWSASKIRIRTINLWTLIKVSLRFGLA